MAHPRPNDRFTPAELELMNILWKAGSSTVQQVMDRLPPERALAYTTVQTMLGVLHRKNKVRRVYRNRAYHYEAMVSREGAEQSAIRDLVERLFGGAPERMMLAMVETHNLTTEKIDEMQRMLDEARARSQKEDQ